MATTQFFPALISADSHVFEPTDLWWKALGTKFGDRTPRVIEEYQGEKGTFFYNGYQGCPVSRIRQQLSRDTEGAAMDASDKGFEACGYDPAVRVRFQEEAAIDAEFMNPTSMLAMFRNPDVEVLQGCSQVYNDWIAEFVAYDPKRLIGMSVIPLHEVDWAVQELERTLKKNLVSPMINCRAPQGCPPYRDPVYDRFWAAAEEAGAPVTLHLLTGWVLDALILARTGQSEEEVGDNPGLWIDLVNEIQTTVANDFIFGGILDRFPKLKVLCSEFEISWIPGFLSRLDQIEDIASRLNLPKLQRPARDYMTDRIWHGFIDDTAADFAIPAVGASQILWGSDFPHIRSIGLEAQSTLHDQLQYLSQEDQNRVVASNAAALFQLN